MPDTGGASRSGDRHLMVCVMGPDADGNFPMVPIDSYHARADGTCILNVGDHPYLTKKSYAGYYLAKKLPSAGTDQLIESGYYKMDVPVSPEILHKIRVGFLASDETPLFMEAYLKKRALPGLIKLIEQGKGQKA